jgi:hypothetical protein
MIAYWKQLCAKPVIDSSVLYIPIATPGALKLNTSNSCLALPSLGVNERVRRPGVLITISCALYFYSEE